MLMVCPMCKMGKDIPMDFKTNRQKEVSDATIAPQKSLECEIIVII